MEYVREVMVTILIKFKINKMKQLFETNYVVYDKLEDEILLLNNGDVAIYGNKEEADADCLPNSNEEAIKCTDLPLHWHKEIIKQINKD